MNGKNNELEFLILKEIRKFILEYGDHFDTENKFTLIFSLKSNFEKLYNLLRLSSGLKPVHDLQEDISNYKEWMEQEKDVEDFDGGRSGYGAEFDRDTSDQGDTVKDLIDYLGYDGSAEGLSADDIWERTGH